MDGEPQWSREWSRKLTDFATNITGRSGGQVAHSGWQDARRKPAPYELFMDGTIFR